MNIAITIASMMMVVSDEEFDVCPLGAGEFVTTETPLSEVMLPVHT